MSIDEEEMEALDEALSVVFQKKQEKAEKKKQKKSGWKDLTMTSLSLSLSLSSGNKMVMMHFKMRLVLSEIFAVDLLLYKGYSI